MHTEDIMNKKGFTLMELLVVLVIIGILTTIALPGYIRSVERARATEALGALKALNESISIYFVEKQRCPARLGQLTATLPTESTKSFDFTINDESIPNVPGTACPGAKATRNSGAYRYFIWNPFKPSESGKPLALQCWGNTKDDQEFCKTLDLRVEENPS